MKNVLFSTSDKGTSVFGHYQKKLWIRVLKTVLFSTSDIGVHANLTLLKKVFKDKNIY
jgi:hypothetical protein